MSVGARNASRMKVGSRHRLVKVREVASKNIYGWMMAEGRSLSLGKIPTRRGEGSPLFSTAGRAEQPVPERRPSANSTAFGVPRR